MATAGWLTRRTCCRPSHWSAYASSAAPVAAARAGRPAHRERRGHRSPPASSLADDGRGRGPKDTAPVGGRRCPLTGPGTA
eukprot:7245509-Prymnesium_polylepis.2